MRGFESVSNIAGDIKLPKRGTKSSAGYDFFLLDKVEFQPGEIKKIKTGIKAYMPDDEFLSLYIRSSVGIKGIFMKNIVGIIDADYYNNPQNEGEIMMILENTSNEIYIFEKGDRLVQGIFQKYYTTTNEENLQKREGGFGSTTKN